MSAHDRGISSPSSLARSVFIPKAMGPTYRPIQKRSGSLNLSGIEDAALELYGAVSPLFFASMCRVPTPPTQMEALGVAFSASSRATASPEVRRTQSTLMPVSFS